VLYFYNTLFRIFWVLGTPGAERAVSILACAFQPRVARVTIIAVKFNIITAKSATMKTPNFVLGIKL
jgi:hypothetical protein